MSDDSTTGVDVTDEWETIASATRMPDGTNFLDFVQTEAFKIAKESQ